MRVGDLILTDEQTDFLNERGYYLFDNQSGDPAERSMEGSYLHQSEGVCPCSRGPTKMESWDDILVFLVNEKMKIHEG